MRPVYSAFSLKQSPSMLVLVLVLVLSLGTHGRQGKLTVSISLLKMLQMHFQWSGIGMLSQESAPRPTLVEDAARNPHCEITAATAQLCLVLLEGTFTSGRYPERAAQREEDH